MFIERLNRESLGEYLIDVVLWQTQYDEVYLCETHNWYSRVGDNECKQLVYQVTQNGEPRREEYDLVDFDTNLRHCHFMLERFGREYLDYLYTAVRESDLNEVQQTKFLIENRNILNSIEEKRRANLKGKQTSLFEY